MFTEAQKVSIRKYMGHHGRFLTTDSDLEKAMVQIATKPAYEEEIVSLLGKCDAIDTAIQTVPRRLKATEAGPIKLDASMELSNLRSIGRQYSSQIAALLGVRMDFDVWAGGMLERSSGYYGPQGGGGMIPFGG